MTEAATRVIAAESCLAIQSVHALGYVHRDLKPANILIDEDYKIIPKDGVYFIRTTIDNKLYNGMMNIGHRPTIGNKAKSIEVNLFNFDMDIYDKVISVDVVVKIRDEKKFSSINALKAQLAKDEEHCQELINK